MSLLRLTLLLALFYSASALCPGIEKPCSGHGKCGKNDKCTCYRNWIGQGCNQRRCPFANAWSGYEPSTGAGGVATIDHPYLECAGKGICDRDTGQCQCYAGFEGKGCTRMKCPNDCNGHGTCEYLDDIHGSYALWDAHKIQTCKCDPGYTGTDCSQKLCRPGDDPVTEGSNSQIQKLDLSSSSTGYFTLTYQDWRGEQWTTWALNRATVTAIAIEEALKGLPNQAIPKLAVEETSAGSDIYEITFDIVENPGDQTLMTLNSEVCNTAGCQPMISAALDVAGSLTIDTAADSLTELDPCSNRGKCDTLTGLCVCEAGYYGESCHIQTIIT